LNNINCESDVESVAPSVIKNRKLQESSTPIVIRRIPIVSISIAVVNCETPYSHSLTQLTTISLYFVGFLFLYGVYHLMKSGNRKITLSSPISPPIESWFFMTVDFWPRCTDLRYQFARTITYQFVHGETTFNN
jgi:hypothetical protein